MDWILAGKLVFVIALLVTGLVVSRYGETYERAAFAIIVVGSAFTALITPVLVTAGTSARYAFVIIDLIVLVGFDAIMVRARSVWPIWVTGLQLAAVCLGAAMLIEPILLGQYRLIQGKWSYVMLVAITIGCCRRMQN